MKIVKPTLKEAKAYYISNKDHYDMLSSYYSIHDPEFHKTIFLPIEHSFDRKKYKRRIQKLVTGSYVFSILIIMLLAIVYIFPIKINIGYTEYEFPKFSFEITSFELPDFEKGMDKFKNNRYVQAKEYFEKVSNNDDSYPQAIEMIEECNKKIDEEGVTQFDRKSDRDTDSRKVHEADDILIH